MNEINKIKEINIEEIENILNKMDLIESFKNVFIEIFLNIVIYASEPNNTISFNHPKIKGDSVVFLYKNDLDELRKYEDFQNTFEQIINKLITEEIMIWLIKGNFIKFVN